jgi:hypothetical protein
VTQSVEDPRRSSRPDDVRSDTVGDAGETSRSVDHGKEESPCSGLGTGDEEVALAVASTA